MAVLTGAPERGGDQHSRRPRCRATRADRSPQEVGVLLRAACLGALMTPEDLAEKWGVNIRTISALERCRTSRPASQDGPASC